MSLANLELNFCLWSEIVLACVLMSSVWLALRGDRRGGRGPSLPWKTWIWDWSLQGPTWEPREERAAPKQQTKRCQTTVLDCLWKRCYDLTAKEKTLDLILPSVFSSHTNSCESRKSSGLGSSFPISGSQAERSQEHFTHWKSIDTPKELFVYVSFISWNLPYYKSNSFKAIYWVKNNHSVKEASVKKASYNVWY